MGIGFVLPAHSSGARHNPFDLRRPVQSITLAVFELHPVEGRLKCQAHAEIGEQTTIAGSLYMSAVQGGSIKGQYL